MASDPLKAIVVRPWARLGTFRDGPHLLFGASFKGLPGTARVFCVGARAGTVSVHLAGAERPNQFFHAGLNHGWCSTRSPLGTSP